MDHYMHCYNLCLPNIPYEYLDPLTLSDTCLSLLHLLIIVAFSILNESTPLQLHDDLFPLF